MSDIRVKACPILGCSYSGEGCINFTWDGSEGYCCYFQKYTNHEKQK